MGQDLVNLAQQILGGLARFVSVTFGIALSLFGMLFVDVCLLANVRKIKAAYLMAAPERYRQDARELWDDFAFLLGVPYALLLGAWVSLTAIIP